MKVKLLSLTISAILTVVFGFIIIPILKRFKIGQPILGYVTEHEGKKGTPTMGGIIFILGAIVTFFIFNDEKSRLSTLAISVALGFLVVGFLDDFLKIKFSKNEGLTPIQKFAFQTIISLIASYFSFNSGLDFLYIPFFGGKFSLGALVILLNALVFVATVNSVNLTDGLDGLCASVSLVVFVALSVLIYIQTKNFPSYINAKEYNSLALFSLCMAGSMLGYLLFNVNKASVFMGDTGSLSIGGAISSIAVLSGNTLFIPFIGVFYLISTLSVIIQVAKFKRTGKRVFLMAPFHHHLQKKGFSEGKISFAYAFFTFIISAFSIICSL